MANDPFWLIAERMRGEGSALTRHMERVRSGEGEEQDAVSQRSPLFVFRFFALNVLFETQLFREVLCGLERGIERKSQKILADQTTWE